MARISGINIPLNKRTEIGLTYIYGVGRSTSNQVLAEAGVDPNTYVKDLTEDEVRKLLTERQAPDGDRFVQGAASPARPAGERPADQDQRARPQGAEARVGHGRRQEEDQEALR